MAFIMERRFFLRSFLRRIFHTNHCTGLYFCTNSTTNFTSVPLKERGHIEVTGEDSVKFLQGLLTNDVNLFYCDSQLSAMYAMMLNTKGRVLYDLLLYKQQRETTGFLIECDLTAVDSIIKNFRPYKMRSKVAFNDVSENLSSWVIMEEGSLKGLQRTDKDLGDIILVNDPRIRSLGARLVLPKSEGPAEYYSNIKEISDQSVYNSCRVRLGVGEGMKDIEPGVPLPLEYNITELHGVSFQKGCYIGQELTARTYHTGVVRKRLMPVKLASSSETEQPHIDKGTSIVMADGKRAGKLVSVYGTLGLGLMRLDAVKSADGLLIAMSDGKNIDVTVDWPSWWNFN